MRLKTREDFEKLTEVTEDRKKWKEPINVIYIIAKVERNLVCLQSLWEEERKMEREILFPSSS